MKSVSKWSEVPNFNTKEDEAAYWMQTRLEQHLLDASLHKTEMRDSTTITLRFDPRMLARIKRLARARYLNYQSMIKQWLAERLEDEL